MPIGNDLHVANKTSYKVRGPFGSFWVVGKLKVGDVGGYSIYRQSG